MKKVLIPALFSVPLFFTAARSQGYQALHGSAYTGSTAVFNNPAASVNSAYKWDVTLFSAQAKQSTNSVYLKNFSLGNQDSMKLTLQEKYHSRFVHANVDLSLFNVLYKINNRQAVNIGMRVRSYTHAKTLPFNYSDTITSLHSFLVQNANTPFVDGFVTNTNWLEADLNYSQVLFENSNSKLSGGITLQVMKGLAGSYVRINKLSYLMSKFSTDTTFSFTSGSLLAGYSANMGATTGKDYLAKTVGGLGLSLGVEYMTYNTDRNPYGNHNLNYDWKIGVSLMDLGANSFMPGEGSGTFNNPQVSLQDADVDKKFSGAANAGDLGDSLKTIFATSTDLESNFSISNPTRLIINIDKNFGNNFYVNGEVSMNFYSSNNYTKLRTRELNLLTVTPRWETIGLGAYLPLQYNTQGQLWIGAAFKAGPLTIGVHDLGILFKKDPLLNGGAYLLLSIHPFNKRRVLSKMDCYE
jgi:hypothetical protein